MTSPVPPLVAKQVRELFIDHRAHAVSLETSFEATTIVWLRIYESTVQALRKRGLHLDYVQLSGTEVAISLPKKEFIDLRRIAGRKTDPRDYLKSRINPEQEPKK
tara:strand:- start:59 stop:373 length:315 start_codon:yes stop_codon:yes gene_type:complete